MSVVDDYGARIAAARQRREPFAGITFSSDDPVFVAAAPGRLDVMGGVADYSGSLVAEATIEECAVAAAQRTSSGMLRISSPQAGAHGHSSLVEVSIDEVAAGAHGCDGLRRRLASEPEKRWALYVVGCVLVMHTEKYLPLPLSGIDFAIWSDVPIGAGVSSSAAIEVASMLAIAAALGVDIPSDRIAVLSQQVENRIVGAPCGIMDQMSVAHGLPSRLLLLLCRPHEILGYQELPSGVRVWGINSAVKHSVGASPYARARVAAFMGKRVANSLLDPAQPQIKHLCEVSPTRYRRDFAPQMPSQVLGQEFLNWLGETGDAVTRIDPEQRYPVRASTEHAIYENHRVEQFIAHLKAASAARGHAARVMPLVRAGAQMYASHWSYTRIGLGSRETSLLVRIARELGTARGVYGAKITGGGSGGTVAILTEGGASAEKSIAEVEQRYTALTGLTPHIVEAGASAGALDMGVARID